MIHGSAMDLLSQGRVIIETAPQDNTKETAQVQGILTVCHSLLVFRDHRMKVFLERNHAVKLPGSLSI